MITAIIAEKPSVAKDIANVLGVRERHDGYLAGNDYGKARSTNPIPAYSNN